MVRRRIPVFALALPLVLAVAGCPSDAAAPEVDAAQQDALEVDALADDTTASGEDTASPGDDTAAADTVAPVALVVVNEVVSARLDGGDDWVELYNAGGAAADLSGWEVADDSDNTYVIADGTTLAPRAFLVIEEADLGFGLGKDDAVTLRDADGVTVDLADWAAGDAPAGWSYGRMPDGQAPFRTLNHPTPGSANDDVLVTVVLNEIVAADADGGDDWIELYVPGPAAQDVSGWVLGDDGGNTWEIPAETALAAGEHRVFTQADFDFGLGKADAVLLFDRDGVLLQATAWNDGDADAGASWGRSPDGTGDFATLDAPTPGATNP